MQKLVQALYLATGDPTAERMLAALKLVKPPTENASDNHRAKRALTPAMADKVLRVWEGERPIQRRNAALIALLALTGLRRSEAAVLRWSDIDLENRVVSVRHGKGDKAREVAIVGEYAVEALLVWAAPPTAACLARFRPLKRAFPTAAGLRPPPQADQRLDFSASA